MLVQDTLTGYLHEVPDGQLSEWGYGEFPEHMGEVVYDGFGNPVGLPFLAPIASALAPMAMKALPALASRFLPAAARLFGRARRALPPGVVSQLAPAAQAFRQALPGAIQQFAPAAQAFQQALPGVMTQLFPGAGGGEAGFAEGPSPMAMRPVGRPFPPGWIPRPHPYTGLRPRRFYMRCLAWPGPRGLVPVSAAQAPAAAIAPPAAAAAAPQAAAMRLMGRRRFRRRR